MAERDESIRRIGELARETGLTVRTLRHYDQLGLLSPSARTSGGHRCYTGGDVRRLHRILSLRSFGFSLGQIRETLAAEPDHDPAELVRRQLDVVEERLRQTLELRSRLLGVLGALGRTAGTSTEQFLQVIEEMTTMTQPLTPEQAARLIEARRKWAAGLGEEELAELNRKRDQVFAGLGDEERRRLTEQRRRMLPLTVGGSDADDGGSDADDGGTDGDG
ncbi:MerR family transcriptional regulator [Streptomyces sp. NPDC002896]|uniref:MerR family transcriptional regulator n=1 Tax=Streptomyces sp. NPDC002896 TaxID=3154438 RepID=UPI00332E1506